MRHIILSSVLVVASIFFAMSVTPVIQAAEGNKLHPVIPPPEGYYKTFFIQKGIGANTKRNCPPAMKHLDETHGLGYEYFDEGGGTKEEQQVRSTICFSGEAGLDDNSRLLYPDGAPRFALIFFNGGYANTQAKALGAEGRNNVLKFYEGGGSVMGSCAGGWILTASKWSGTEGIGIWPGKPFWAQLGSIKLDVTLEKDCPLLKYDDFGGNLVVENVSYNKGPYFSTRPLPEGTEILTRFNSLNEELQDKIMHRIGKVETLAYKKDEATGRAILCGAHPESSDDPNAENYRYFKALIHYAFDGRGSPRVKAELKSGEARFMTDNKLIGHEKIGDLQYHHFTITVPERTKKLTVTLAGSAKQNGDTQYDLNLFLKHGAFAFPSAGRTQTSTGKGSEEIITILDPPVGTWYAAVVCMDSVTAVPGSPFAYSGKTGVLNGVAYSIRSDIE